MTSPHRPGTIVLERQLPAAVVALWAPEVPADALRESIDQLFPRAGMQKIGEHRLVCWPSARDPAIYDSAIHLGLRIADQLRQRAGRDAARSLRVLILPARAFLRGDDAWIEGDPVVQALCDDPELPLEPGIYLTSRAALRLEAGWSLAEEGHFVSPAGPVIPLASLSEASYRTARRRNTRVLRRPTRFVEREDLANRLEGSLTEGPVRITGPLGCGKSRLVWEILKDRPGTTIFCAPFLGGELGLSLAEELWSQLARETPVAAYELTGHAAERRLRAEARVETWLHEMQGGHHPFYIVLDDLDRAPSEDLAWLDRVLNVVGGSVELLLVARPGVLWPSGCYRLPEIEIGPADEATTLAIVDQLSSGLDMPREVLDRVAAASAGNLFALEEGIHELTHRGSISQIYGSFFFGGSSETRYAPSSRWICHVHAEMERLGSTTALLALAALDRPVPLEVLERVADLFAARPESGWAPELGLAGWIHSTQSPWGRGLEFSCQALGEGLAATLTQNGRDRLRTEVGRRLADRCPDSSSRWELYRALVGTQVGSDLLVETLGPIVASIPREEAYRAILDELQLHRHRGGDPDGELKLLWTLLPIAKRIGRLASLREELDVAVDLAHDQPEMLVALQALRARLAREEHRLADAEVALGEALQLAIRIGSRRKGVLALELGALLVEQKRHDEARQVLEQLLLETPDSSWQAATCRFRLAEIARRQLCYDKAKELHEAALASRREIGQPLAIARSLCGLADICILQGDYPHALAHLEEARDVFQQAEEPLEEAYALAGIGRVLSHLGRAAEASKPLRLARERFRGRDKALDEAVATLAVAQNHLELGQVEAAEEVAMAARFQLDLMEDSPAGADCDLVLGRIRIRQKRYDAALDHLQRALEGHRTEEAEAEVAEDRSFILEAAVAKGAGEQAERLAVELDGALRELAHPGRRELMELRLFRSLEQLVAWGFEPPIDPGVVIGRAYEHLLRKTSFLDQEQRNRFLLEVPENQQIVEEATRLDIPLPRSRPI